MEIADIIAEMRNLADDLSSGITDEGVRWEDVLQVNWKARSLIHATEEWQRLWKRRQTSPVTKWDLISDQQRAYLDSVLLGRVIDCSTCGWTITTEGEFARHYVVTDINYTNLGTCWTRVAPEYAGRRPEWPKVCIEMHCRSAAKEHYYGSDLCDWKIDNGEVSAKED